jgi:hypothetical protein
MFRPLALMAPSDLSINGDRVLLAKRGVAKIQRFTASAFDSFTPIQRPGSASRQKRISRSER